MSRKMRFVIAPDWLVSMPVWVKIWINLEHYGDCCSYSDPTNTPNWNIPNAEYSFTEFKEEV